MKFICVQFSVYQQNSTDSIYSRAFQYEQRTPILWEKFAIETEKHDFDLKTVYSETFVFSSDWINAWQCGCHAKSI